MSFTLFSLMMMTLWTGAISFDCSEVENCHCMKMLIPDDFEFQGPSYIYNYKEDEQEITCPNLDESSFRMIINDNKSSITAYCQSQNIQLPSILLKKEEIIIYQCPLNAIQETLKITNKAYIKSLKIERSSLPVLNDSVIPNYDLRRLELHYVGVKSIESKTLNKLKNLEDLILDYNEIIDLHSEMFENLQNLKTLSLRNNEVTTLSKEMFKDLVNLEKLDLWSNRIQSLSAETFHNLKNLKYLDVSSNDLSFLDEKIFEALPLLEVINLSFNKIQKVSPTTFSRNYHLQNIVLSGNKIKKIPSEIFINTRNLQELDLSGIGIKRFPNLKYLNLLKKLSFANNAIEVFDLKNLPDNLEELDLSFNLLRNVDIEKYLHFSKLKTINFSYNKIKLLQISQVLLHDHKQMSVDLTYNSIKEIKFQEFIQEACIESGISIEPAIKIAIDNNPLKCDCHLLDFARYLESSSCMTLVLSFMVLTCNEPQDLKDVNVRYVTPPYLLCPVEDVFPNSPPCTKLCDCYYRSSDDSIIVDCMNKNLTAMPEFILPAVYNKLEIYVQNNSFQEFPDEKEPYINITSLFMSHNNITRISWIPKNIEVLQLDHNNIEFLDKAVIEMLNSSKNLVNLTLNDNPWICNCEVNDFSSFLAQHHEQVDTTNIKCAKGEQLVEFFNTKDLCTIKLDTILTIIGITIVICMIASLFVLSYRYRKLIKAWLYNKNLCLWFFKEQQNDRNKRFDIFMSYSPKDEHFVLKELVPVLESRPYSFKLCLYRDWLAGESIVKQVADSIEQSKRTVIILSNNYLESEWSIMEFQAAHLQAMKDQRRRVVIILKDRLEIKTLPNELRFYMRTYCYFKWNDKHFWNKLVYALPHKKIKDIQESTA